MAKFGKDEYRDEESWGQRTSWGAKNMSDSQRRDSMAVREMASDDDVCSSRCEKFERDWRREALADKGLQEFTGTGEGVKDGVSFSEAMYENQVTGARKGNR